MAKRYPTGVAIVMVLALFTTPIALSLALFGAAPPPQAQAPSPQSRPAAVPAADPVVADLAGPPRRMSVVHIVEHVATEFDTETGITWYGYKTVAVDDAGPGPGPEPPIPGPGPAPEPPDPGDTLGGRLMKILGTVPAADRLKVKDALGAAVVTVRAKVESETPESAAVEVVSKAMEALDTLDHVQAVSDFGGLIQEVSPAELDDRMGRLETMLQ